MQIESQQPPTRVILEQANPWSRWFARAGWIVAGIAVLSAIGSAGAFSRYFQRDSRVVEKWHSLSKLAADKVAIVSVTGAILGGDGFVRAQLDQAEEDEAVKAIVLRVDSPGGTVSGSDEIHHRLAKLVEKRDIPVVVSMGGIAASGGYYVAMANRGKDDVIFAEPATLTGSIGVIIPHFDISQALRKYDIRDDSIASGPLKEMLSVSKDRTPELAEKERKLIQELVDDMFRRFKEIVKAGRPKLDDAAVDRVATGQIFTARQALEAGLVDRIGFLEDAVDRAVELAGLSAEKARVVKYTKPKGLLDEVLGGASPTGRVDLTAIAELTTPRGWYLCSWLPALVRSE
ncbi:MAG: signal peptide peptidase SppA [Planctomycetota bacterium]|jgi:protease-4